MNDVMTRELDELLRGITFESEVIKEASSMSQIQLENAINERIQKVLETTENPEQQELYKYEARVLSLMALRRG